MLSFQSVHDAKPPWSVSTSSSATTVVKLNWSGFDDVEVRYIGWDGPEEDESDREQVDDADQEDIAKID